MMEKLQLVPGNTKKFPTLPEGVFVSKWISVRRPICHRNCFFVLNWKANHRSVLSDVIENVWAVVCSETTRSWLIIRWHGSVAQLIMDLVCKASQAGYIRNELKGPYYGVFCWILILASCQNVLNTLDHLKKFQVFVTLLPPSVGFW